MFSCSTFLGTYAKIFHDCQVPYYSKDIFFLKKKKDPFSITN